MMFGWLSAEAARASCAKRRSRSASLAKEAGKKLVPGYWGRKGLAAGGKVCARPATPEQRQDFVCSDALPGEQVRSCLTELFRSKPPRLKRQRVPLDKAPRRAVISQQLF